MMNSSPIFPVMACTLTAEGNAIVIVHKELVEVLKDAGFRAENMLYDFPHHSEIDGDHPEKAFCKKS